MSTVQNEVRELEAYFRESLQRRHQHMDALMRILTPQQFAIFVHWVEQGQGSQEAHSSHQT